MIQSDRFRTYAQDMADAARSLDRAREYRQQHGRSEKWIQQWMMGNSPYSKNHFHATPRRRNENQINNKDFRTASGY